MVSGWVVLWGMLASIFLFLGALEKEKIASLGLLIFGFVFAILAAVAMMYQ
jgi:hypothetical protein